ncbi:MAG TPA: hypothetical protein VD967_00565 [Candidatus Paceibacterota bacterium]|nr:hypothetical protein [Candidatus Paceibacterota bacterium]
MKRLYLLAFSLLAPLAAFAQQSSYSRQTFASLVNGIVSFVNPLVSLLVSLTILIFLYNMMRYVWTAGDSKEHGEAARSIGWSLLGLFVLFAVWGIISLAAMTLFGSSSTYSNPGDPCRVDPGSSFIAC